MSSVLAFGVLTLLVGWKAVFLACNKKLCYSRGTARRACQ